MCSMLLQGMKDVALIDIHNYNTLNQTESAIFRFFSFLIPKWSDFGNFILTTQTIHKSLSRYRRHLLIVVGYTSYL